MLDAKTHRCWDA